MGSRGKPSGYPEQDQESHVDGQQDYELDIEVDPEAWQKSKYIAFYDAVRHGGFARYFSVEEYESYITKKGLCRMGTVCAPCTGKIVY